jgi:predicted RNA binding protein YcfA (HicA-like mRNA interferase family)
MPRKIRELVRDLVKAGFEERSGKGSHRNYSHPLVAKVVTIRVGMSMMLGGISRKRFKRPSTR